jgi:hypothetical protein
MLRTLLCHLAAVVQQNGIIERLRNRTGRLADLAQSPSEFPLLGDEAGAIDASGGVFGDSVAGGSNFHIGQMILEIPT